MENIIFNRFVETLQGQNFRYLQTNIMKVPRLMMDIEINWDCQATNIVIVAEIFILKECVG